MDAYDRRDFDRLSELYAEDIRWSAPGGLGCENREDVFTLFRSRMESGDELSFDEIRALPGRVLVRGHLEPHHQPFYSVFAVKDGRIAGAKDFESRDAAEATFAWRKS